MIFDKRYFEKVFSSESPWGYATSEYEKRKYVRQIEAIRQCCPQPETILEVGCAEGIHTAMLAEAFPQTKILCVEISRNAIERAKKYLEQYGNIELREGDIIELFTEGGLPKGEFDVIIQSECLYYLFPTFLFKRNLVSYLKGISLTLKHNGVFVTSNGINLVTSSVMGFYYLILGRLCKQVIKAEYREWNEFRRKRIKYDLRVFKQMN